MQVQRGGRNIEGEVYRAEGIREANIVKLKRDIEELEKRCNLRKNVRKNVSNLQRLKTIEEFFEQWDKLKTKEEKIEC